VIRIRVTAAPRRATVVPIPTGRGLALLADVADRECRDGFSQPVIGRKHPVVAMPGKMVPATKSGQDASFSIFGGWHLLPRYPQGLSYTESSGP